MQQRKPNTAKKQNKETNKQKNWGKEVNTEQSSVSWGFCLRLLNVFRSLMEERKNWKYKLELSEDPWGLILFWTACCFSVSFFLVFHVQLPFGGFFSNTSCLIPFWSCWNFSWMDLGSLYLVWDERWSVSPPSSLIPFRSIFNVSSRPSYVP